MIAPTGRHAERRRCCPATEQLDGQNLRMKSLGGRSCDLGYYREQRAASLIGELSHCLKQGHGLPRARQPCSQFIGLESYRSLGADPVFRMRPIIPLHRQLNPTSVRPDLL